MPTGIVRTFSFLSLLLFVGLFAPLSTVGNDVGDFLDIQRRITDLLDRHIDGVVRVKAAAEEPTGVDEVVVTQRVGTGFLISSEGHILTNASVAYGADRIWIELDGVSYAADHLGSDLETNVSLLKLMTLPTKFSFFRIPSDPSRPTIGSFALAITAPLEFGPSPSLGMVVGKESEFSGRVFPITYTRVNIPAHPGEGGSPVLDLNGRLIGIIVASLPEVQSSYLLPVRALNRIRDALLLAGEVRYGTFGFEVEERFDRGGGRSVLIVSIASDTAAAEADIKEGDRLLKIGDRSIGSLNDFRNASFYYEVDEFVELTLSRDGEELRFPLKVAEKELLPKSEPGGDESAEDTLVPR